MAKIKSGFLINLIRRKSPATKDKESISLGPDFSKINSIKKAEKMYRKGELEKLHLVPIDFGGPDSAENTVYVPVGTAEIKENIDFNIIEPMVAEGSVSHYSASLDYQEDSVIPISIDIEVTQPGSFSSQIAVWGEALKQELHLKDDEKNKTGSIAPLKLKDKSTYQFDSPSSTVKEFIIEFEKWNNWAFEFEENESSVTTISKGYNKIISCLCAPSVIPQPASYGSESNHTPKSERIINEESSGNHAVVYTKQVGAHNFESDYEYHLILIDGKWLINSLLYVCDDGKYECL